MKRHFTLFLLVISGFLIFSCQKRVGKRDNKQILRINFLYEPLTFDPRRGSDSTSSTVHFLLYEGLTRMTPESTHEPGLAERIDISNDKLTYTFHLRESTWSNGDSVTAYDFDFAWRSMVEPTFPCINAHLLYPIKNAEKVKRGIISSSELGVRALDDRTLEVTLETPCPYFLDLISFCVFFPIPHKIVKTCPKWGDNLGPELVTNGPFRAKEWQRSNFLTFEKNPLFWEKGKPKLDSIQLSFVSNGITAYGMYKKGEIDFLGHCVTPIPFDYIPKLAEAGSLNSQPLAATAFCTFNLNRSIFQNKNIRTAFSYAIDRKSLIENITQFNEFVATGCISPVLKNNVLKNFYPDKNIQEATRHLELGLRELGLTKKDLHNLTLSYFTHDIYKKVALALQQQWKEALGIDIKLEENEFKVLMDRLNKRDYEIALTGWVAQYKDQTGILNRFKFRQNPKNYPAWENPEYIRLLDESAFAETEEKRFALLEQAEKIITEDMPLACLYHWNSVYIQKSYVKNFYISPIGSVHLNETYIEN